METEDRKKRRRDYKRRWIAKKRLCENIKNGFTHDRKGIDEVAIHTYNSPCSSETQSSSSSSEFQLILNNNTQDNDESEAAESDIFHYGETPSIPAAEFSNPTPTDLTNNITVESNTQQYYPFSSDEDADLDEESITHTISEWACEYNIKHNAIDNLLKSFREKHGFKNLPATARTLLKTPRNVTVRHKSGMDYVYLGIKQQIQLFLSKYPDEICNNVSVLDISLNIDGLPLFKSTKAQLWPILCAIQVHPIQIFPVALCLEKSKPVDLEFMFDTISDLNDMLRNGLHFKGKIINVQLQNIVCDAPARALIKGTKAYSGYYGCDRCSQKGKWIKKMTYQQTLRLELRTDASFRSLDQPGHHKNLTPLTDLYGFDLIKQIPLDYMHQSCLGVMKRLLMLWVAGPQRALSPRHKEEVSERLIGLRPSIPSLFARKPRGLDELDYWKATEYRQFLLYSGKLALKGILRSDLYHHFLTLNVIIAILVSPALVVVKRYTEYARKLASYFVRQGRVLYGKGFMVYNTHLMLHIADDAEEFGSLDECSAFPYENCLQKIKKLVRSGSSPLVQVAKRLSEHTTFAVPKPRQTSPFIAQITPSS